MKHSTEHFLSCAIVPEWAAPVGVSALSTTRAGGVSAPPYASCNLGLHVGDDAQAVHANRAALAAALPEARAVQWLEQVHGVVVVQANDANTIPVADACWSREPGIACAVMTADCLPVLLTDTAGTVVAAVHAGWRGLQAGVLEETIAAMDAAPAKLLAWMGPAIGPQAFEVGGEVRDLFLSATALNPAIVDACFTANPANPQHYFADIYGLAAARLAALGVTQVSGKKACTYSESQRFFSYRRSGQTGRMASVIMLNRH